MKKYFQRAAPALLRASLFPSGLLLSAVILYILYRARIAPDISPALEQELRKYIITGFTLCSGYLIHKVTKGMFDWYREFISRRASVHTDDLLLPLISRAALILIWICVLLVILPLYGINITALVALLGVGSLAVSLAAQDTVANIIAGFLIIIDRPFHRGDRIKLPSGEIVEVLNIGIRRSRFLLAEEKAIVIVPNLDLSRNKIVNYTYAGEQPEGEDTSL